MGCLEGASSDRNHEARRSLRRGQGRGRRQPKADAFEDVGQEPQGEDPKAGRSTIASAPRFGKGGTVVDEVTKAFCLKEAAAAGIELPNELVAATSNITDDAVTVLNSSAAETVPRRSNQEGLRRCSPVSLRNPRVSRR